MYICIWYDLVAGSSGSDGDMLSTDSDDLLTQLSTDLGFSDFMDQVCKGL
jgi:hypothetical protein